MDGCLFENSKGVETKTIYQSFEAKRRGDTLFQEVDIKGQYIQICAGAYFRKENCSFGMRLRAKCAHDLDSNQCIVLIIKAPYSNHDFCILQLQ